MPNLVPRSHSVLHWKVRSPFPLAVGDLGTRLSSASLAFSFVSFYTPSDVWLQHLFNIRDPAKKPVSFIYALCGPLHSIIFFSFDKCVIRLSLRKQPTLGDATTGFPAKWRLRNERRKSMTDDASLIQFYPDRSCRVGNLIQPIRSTNQIWVMTRHQYGISALVSQTSFGGETSNSVAKCRLFSQAISCYTDVSPVAPTPFGFLLLLFLCVCVCVVLQIYIVYH